MKIIKTTNEMRSLALEEKISENRIACVPTMGFLHEGHLSLIKRAKQVADVVVVTLFVNPTQFSPNEDFAQYPRDLQRDSELCLAAGADYLFAPSAEEIYPAGYNTEVAVKGVSELFEGKFRPIHFNGVATVVAKLFNIIHPDYAVFGQKDYQQTLVVKQMVRDLLLGVEIIVAPIIRENSGLAKSSRNTYLSDEQKTQALVLSQSLKLAADAIAAGETKSAKINKIMHDNIEKSAFSKIDYACAARAKDLTEPEEFAHGEEVVLLIAAYLGKVRLIDNCLVTIK